MSNFQRFGFFSTISIVAMLVSLAHADTGLVSSTYLASRKVNGAALTNADTRFYGTGSGAADIAAKAVSIPSIGTLSEGQIIVVNPETTSSASGAHTLALNSGTAYPIYYNGTALNNAADASKIWKEGIPATFVLDGTGANAHWVFAGSGSDTGETYTQGTGITISDGTISNAGVRDIDTTNVDNGKIKVNKNGTESTITVASGMSGASVVNSTPTAGTAGLVPAPSAGDQDKILTGGATWKYVQVPVTAGGDPSAASNPAAVSTMASVWIDNTALN